VKKIVLVLGLVTGMVTNAQLAEVSGYNGKVYQVTRLNFDSVEVKSISRGEVLGTDTMNLSRFLTLTNGYKITSGNLHNPIPIAPKIEQPKHKHTLTDEHKEFIGYVSLAAATYGFYKFLMWVTSPPKSSSTPIYYSSSQCSATAESTGQRCKRSRESGRAYCWQH